jgi:hypothetical protein
MRKSTEHGEVPPDHWSGTGDGPRVTTYQTAEDSVITL